MLLPHDRDSLVSVASLPYMFQPLFKYRYFNAVQSESFSEAYLSDENMVVSAPTGSGKTGIFELCILRLLSKSITPNGGHFSHSRGSRKIVYIAPLKALVQEVSREWKEKFGQILGLVCQELTGDTDILKPSQILETDIIITTPEKFDSTTRNHRDHGGAGFFGDIALVLIDEVHLLNDSRGASLEAVVSRIKMVGRYPELKASPIARTRFIAVSATVPNIDDLAEWLRVPERGIKRFGEEMRPVKLTTNVYGYGAAKNDYLFEKRLQNYLYDVIVHHSKGKPTLVFCCTRKGAQDAALILAETVSRPGSPNPFIKSQEQFDRLQVAATGAGDKSIQACISQGVAYHNGGLAAADRALVEGLFLKCDLQVLCTTSTLAQGVNLPAHLVVIKSTQFYNKDKGRYVEHERSTLLQMCGRAGRPQFDDSGVVVLMTRNETMVEFKNKYPETTIAGSETMIDGLGKEMPYAFYSVHLYENILSGSEPVESELLPSIAEHLNAEIVLMTVSDVGLAIDWLKCSYLYVRMRKHPEHYKIEKGITEEKMVKHMRGICLQTVNDLAKYGMVLMDEYGFTLQPLEPGKLMAKYYLNFETMKTITEIPDHSGMAELLSSLAKAQELCWIQLRRHEKKLLNAINQDQSGRIKFHVLGLNGKAKKRIQTYEEKIFLLVNDILSDEPSALDFTMSQDVNGICTNGARIARCMGDYFKYMKRYKETKNSMLLAKCLRQRLWDDSAHQLKQLPGIGTVTVKAFQTAGIDSFEKLATSDPRQLELITGRRFPYGDQVKETLATSLPPKVSITVRQTGFRVAGKNEFTLELTRITQSTTTSSKWHMADLIVGDDRENLILFHERIRLDQFGSPYPVGVYSKHGVSAALICDEYVGIDHLNQLADISKDKATLPIVITEHPLARRERKKQSPPTDHRIVPCYSPPKQHDVNETADREIEHPQSVVVNPKFLQDHNFANQTSLMQLASSGMAPAAWHVGPGGNGMASSPNVTEIPPSNEERHGEEELQVPHGKTLIDGVNHQSCESHDDVEKDFHHSVWSHLHTSSEETQTKDRISSTGDALLHPEISSEITPHPRSSSNCGGADLPRFANATGKPEDLVQISGSTSIQNKRHYWSSSGVPDGESRLSNNGTVPQSFVGRDSQFKRRLALPSDAEKPSLSNVNHVIAEEAHSTRGSSIRNDHSFGCSLSRNETSIAMLQDTAPSTTENAASFSSTGFRPSNFRSVRTDADSEGGWLLGDSCHTTNRQTTPSLTSCKKSPAVEGHLQSSNVAYSPVEGGKSLFSFLFE